MTPAGLRCACSNGRARRLSQVTSPERAAPRLAAHRERLVRLGIEAASFTPANVDRTYREDGNVGGWC